MVAVEAGVARAGRIGVHPIRLEGDPAGPEIALLEHVHSKPSPLGGGDGGHVHLQAVVEDHQVADAILAHVPVDPGGPGRLGVAIADVRSKIAPVRQVAPVEDDLADSGPRLAELVGDVREE